jgi:hypothetical protein
MEVSAVVGDCRRTVRYLSYEDPEPSSAMMRSILQHNAQDKKEMMCSPITPGGEAKHQSKGLVFNGICGNCKT